MIGLATGRKPLMRIDTTVFLFLVVPSHLSSSSFAHFAPFFCRGDPPPPLAVVPPPLCFYLDGLVIVLLSLCEGFLIVIHFFLFLVRVRYGSCWPSFLFGFFSLLLHTEEGRRVQYKKGPQRNN